jgi:hypothetical protein
MPLLASSLARSLVSAHTSCVGTSRSPSASSTTRWRTLSCRRRHVSTHHHASQVSNETGATPRQCASSLALARVDVHCFSHWTLGAYRHVSLLACMLGAHYCVRWYLTIHKSLHPMAFSHMQYAPASMDSPIRYRSLLLLWGELCCMRRRLLLLGNAARSPSQCFGPKSPLGFCPNPHSCCVILTSKYVLHLLLLPMSHHCNRTARSSQYHHVYAEWDGT